MTITLPLELERVLEQRAQQQGTTPETLVIDSLAKIYMPPAALPVEEGGTLADYWADYIGTIAGSKVVPGGANLSENTGRKFAALMVEKYRKGKR